MTILAFSRGSGIPAILLSNTAVSEDLASGSVVGALSVKNGKGGSYTFTITADPDSKFAIDGSNLETDDTLDYETATSHSVTIQADNSAGHVFTQAFTIIVTNVAPVLSSATDTESGATTADLGVTTSESTGTLYAVVTTSATPPTKPQIKSGLDHLGAAAAFADDQAVGSTGEKTFSATGLTAETAYYAHFMHEDAAGNQSNVASGDGFTTDAEVPATTAWNPSDKHAEVTLSGGNLIATKDGSTGFTGCKSVASASTGKKYCEITMVIATFNSANTFGICNATHPNTDRVGQNTNSIGVDGDGPVKINDSTVATVADFNVGDVFCMAVDLDAELIWWRQNGGNWNNSGTADPATGTEGIDYASINAGPYFVAINMAADNDEWAANFGATAYAHTPPSGFGNW